jgi:hypothetical protein
VLGIPSSEGWLEKAAPRPTPNRPQVLRIAVKSLLQGAGPRGLARESSPETYPKSAPSAAYSSQIVASGGAGYPFPRGLARESSPETYPQSAPSAVYSGQIVDWGVLPLPFPSPSPGG